MKGSSKTLPILASIALISQICCVVGCGGESPNQAHLSVSQAVKQYAAAKSADQFKQAVAAIDAACGIGKVTGPFGAYGFGSSQYTVWFAGMCQFEQQPAAQATLGQVLESWRTSPDSNFTTDTSTFLSDFNAALLDAQSNPSDPQSTIPMAVAQLASNSGSLFESTVCDIEMARLLSIWEIGKYGLKPSAALQVAGAKPPANAACAACKANAKVACNTALNNTLTQANNQKQQAITSATNAYNSKLISYQQEQQQISDANAAYSATDTQAQATQASCIANIPTTCAGPCDAQGGN